MTIKDKESFVYGGVDSNDLSIMNVSVDTGMADEQFLANKMINEISIPGRTKPYFMGMEYEPLMFQLSFAFKDTWDDELIREVARVLHVDYYKPLYFNDDDDIIYYCMPTEDIRIIHNSLQQGYVNLTMRCNDIYAYSKVKTLEVNEGFDNIVFRNHGDADVYPSILFMKDTILGDPVIIENQTTEKLCQFEHIGITEQIVIDNEHEHIHTIGAPNLHRYTNHNGVFLKMIPGRNNLVVSGVQHISFYWRLKLLQN